MQLVVLAQPIKFLIIGVVVHGAVPVGDANAHFLSYLLHHSTYVKMRDPLYNFIVFSARFIS